jgi:hypothetical protein
MKLIRRTPNTLIMRYRPWGTWLYCSGLVGLVIVFLMFKVHLSTFTCTRTLPHTNQGYCQLTHHRLASYDRRTFPLDAIKGVNLALQHNPKGGEYYQIYLTTTIEPVELQFYTFQSLDGPQLKARKIQSFLANPNQLRLKIQENTIWISVLFSLVVIGIAWISLLIMGGIRTIQLDRLSGKLRFTCQGIFGTRTFEYPLNHIKDVMIKDIGSFGKKNYYVAIVLKTGFPLVLYPLLAIFRNRGQRQYCAKQILDFINCSGER